MRKKKGKRVIWQGLKIATMVMTIGGIVTIATIGEAIVHLKSVKWDNK